MRPHIPSLLAALALLPAGPALAGDAAPPAVFAHEIAVSLDPSTGSIEGTDLMRVRIRGDGGDLLLDLRADLAIRRLEVDGKALESLGREQKDPRPGLARYRVPIHTLKDAAEVTIAWGGIIREEVKKAETLAFVVGDSSSGTISEKGVYLGEGTGWVPLDGSMATFAITASVPGGWSVATQGGVPSEETKDGKTTFSFPRGIPYDGLWLQAGRWKVERRLTKSGVSVATYFTEEDAGNSELFLDAAEEYLDAFGKVLGPFPHAKFDVVEGFFTTGYGMPTATLLGADVVKHIAMTAARSGGKIPPGYLDHELMHCWWGNGVFVDYDAGNWCEALTTYCSNYLRKEWEGPAEAARHRRGTRSRFAARVRPEKDYPVRRFTGKTEDFENDIGYGKGSMIFHAARRAVGDEAFFGGLRDMVAAFTGKRASWDDFRRAFEKRSGRNLDGLFAQMLDRTGAPVVVLRDCAAAPDGDGFRVTGTVVQKGEPWALALPLVVETAGGPVETTVEVAQAETPFALRTKHLPTRVLLDPEAHCWRGYAPGEVPGSLDATLHKPEGAVVVTFPGDEAPFAPILEALKGREGVRFESSRRGGSPDIPAGAGGLFLGSQGARSLAMEEVPPALPIRFTSRGISAGGKSFDGEDVAVLSSRGDRTYYIGMSPAALSGARRIFYYGGEGTVVFKAGVPVLRLEPEGDESSRAALLDSLLPQPSAERAGETVKVLCEPKVEGRLAGTEAATFTEYWLGMTLAHDFGASVQAQNFSFEVPDWQGVPCLSLGEAPWEGGTPFCFSASTTEWRTPTPLMLGEGATLEKLLADLRAAQAGGAEGVLVVGPVDPPEFLKDYLLFPSTLSAKDRERSPGVDPALLVEGKRARLLSPGFEVKVPVVYLGQDRARSALPSRMRAPLVSRTVKTGNFLAVIPGTDPALAGEAILLGAHHDHLGPGYPGADDDASGVAAVLEAGRTLLARRASLRRPVVIALFGAEEWGLKGSRWFVAHRPDGIPPVVAALTLDTVGSADAPEVNLVGESVYPALAALMGKCLAGAGLRRGADIDKYAFAHGSDHYAFHEAGVPALDLFSGNYRRMHTKQDTLHTVDPGKVARIARAAAAWVLEASREGVPR